MAAVIPDAFKDLVDDAVFVNVSTVSPDGQPQATVVWWDRDDETIQINTTKDRQKYKNFQRDPHVALLAFDPKNPYRWMQIRGVVESITEEGGRDHIESLSRKYTGQHYYGGFNKWSNPEDETRVVVRIRPEKVLTSG